MPKYTYDQLIVALRNADAANDTASAQKIARLIEQDFGSRITSINPLPTLPAEQVPPEPQIPGVEPVYSGTGSIIPETPGINDRVQVIETTQIDQTQAPENQHYQPPKDRFVGPVLPELGFWNELTRSFEQFRKTQLPAMAGGTLSMAGTVTPKEEPLTEYGVDLPRFDISKEEAIQRTLESPLYQMGERIRAKAKEVARQHPELQQPPNAKEFGLDTMFSPEVIGRTIGNVLPSMIISLGAGTATALATRNPALGIAAGSSVAFAMEGGSAYDEARNYGLDPIEAERVGMAVGAANSILEMAPVGKFIKNAGVGKLWGRELTKRLIQKGAFQNISKSALSQMVAESTTEMLQEATQIFQESGYKSEYDKPDKDEILRRLGESGWGGALAGGGVGVVSGTTKAVTSEKIDKIQSLGYPRSLIAELTPKERSQLIQLNIPFQDYTSGIIPESVRDLRKQTLGMTDEGIQEIEQANAEQTQKIKETGDANLKEIRSLEQQRRTAARKEGKQSAETIPETGKPQTAEPVTPKPEPARPFRSVAEQKNIMASRWMGYPDAMIIGLSSEQRNYLIDQNITWDDYNSLTPKGFPTLEETEKTIKETQNAQGIRETEGQVPEAGVKQEVSTEESGKDLEQQTPKEPGKQKEVEPPVTPKIEQKQPVKPVETAKPTQVSPEPQKSVLKPSTRKPVVDVMIDDIATEEGSFQGRFDKFSQKTYDNITADIESGEFTWGRFDPITLWKTPAGVKPYVVLDGHSRFNAIKDAKGVDFDAIPAHIVEAATLEEAIDLAITSNFLQDPQTPPEKASYYRGERKKGISPAELKERAKKFEGKNARKVIRLSYLNPNGKAMGAIQALRKSGEKEYDDAVNMGAWVGEAREIIPELTNSHENEIYDYLKERYGTKITNMNDFVSKIKDIVDRQSFMGEFDASKPLNLKELRTKSDVELEYEQAIRDKEKELSEAKKTLEAKRKTFVSKGATGEKLETALKKYNEEVSALTKELVDLRKNLPGVKSAARNQIALLDKDFGANVKAEPVAKPTDKPSDMRGPELYRFVKLFTPFIKINKRLAENVRGSMNTKTGVISLNPRIFVNENQVLATLSHEFFHFVDYLVDRVAGGNLIGRLAVLVENRNQLIAPNLSNEQIALLLKKRKKLLNKLGYVKGRKNAGATTYRGTDIDKGISNLRSQLDEIESNFIMEDHIRDELWELTKKWRPMSKAALEDPDFVKYRKSTPELYADFGSALLNNREWTIENAPMAYDLWMTNIHKKPEFKKAYDDLLNLMQNEEAIMKLRAQEDDLRVAATKQAIIDKAKASKNANLSLVKRLQRMISIYYPWMRHEYRLIRQGDLKMEDSLVGLFNGFGVYETNAERVWLEPILETIRKPESAGLRDEFEVYIRNAHFSTLRSNVANPGLVLQSDAADNLAELRRKIGSAKFSQLEDWSKELRENTDKVLDLLLENDFISQELHDNLVGGIEETTSMVTEKTAKKLMEAFKKTNLGEVLEYQPLTAQEAVDLGLITEDQYKGYADKSEQVTVDGEPQFLLKTRERNVYAPVIPIHHYVNSGVSPNIYRVNGTLNIELDRLFATAIKHQSMIRAAVQNYLNVRVGERALNDGFGRTLKKGESPKPGENAFYYRKAGELKRIAVPKEFDTNPSPAGELETTFDKAIRPFDKLWRPLILKLKMTFHVNNILRDFGDTSTAVHATRGGLWTVIPYSNIVTKISLLREFPVALYHSYLKSKNIQNARVDEIYKLGGFFANWSTYIASQEPIKALEAGVLTTTEYVGADANLSETPHGYANKFIHGLAKTPVGWAAMRFNNLMEVVGNTLEGATKDIAVTKLERYAGLLGHKKHNIETYPDRSEYDLYLTPHEAKKIKNGLKKIGRGTVEAGVEISKSEAESIGEVYVGADPAKNVGGKKLYHVIQDIGQFAARFAGTPPYQLRQQSKTFWNEVIPFYTIFIESKRRSLNLIADPHTRKATIAMMFQNMAWTSAKWALKYGFATAPVIAALTYIAKFMGADDDDDKERVSQYAKWLEKAYLLVPEYDFKNYEVRPVGHVDWDGNVHWITEGDFNPDNMAMVIYLRTALGDLERTVQTMTINLLSSVGEKDDAGVMDILNSFGYMTGELPTMTPIAKFGEAMYKAAMHQNMYDSFYEGMVIPDWRFGIDEGDDRIRMLQYALKQVGLDYPVTLWKSYRDRLNADPDIKKVFQVAAGLRTLVKISDRGGYEAIRNELSVEEKERLADKLADREFVEGYVNKFLELHPKAKIQDVAKYFGSTVMGIITDKAVEDAIDKNKDPRESIRWLAQEYWKQTGRGDFGNYFNAIAAAKSKEQEAIVIETYMPKVLIDFMREENKPIKLADKAGTQSVPPDVFVDLIDYASYSGYLSSESRALYQNLLKLSEKWNESKKQ